MAVGGIRDGGWGGASVGSSSGAGGIRDGGFAGAARPSTGSSMGGSIGGGYRGTMGGWGTERSVVAGSALGRAIAERARQQAGLLGGGSPMAPYGQEFNFSPQEMSRALVSQAPLVGGTPNSPSVLGLQKMGAQIQADKELQGLLGAINAPFTGATAPAAPTAAVANPNLANAVASALPSNARQMTEPSDFPFEQAASYALGYQNSPIENDIAYLASRVNPTRAAPEALALVDPNFTPNLARSLRAAEAATGTTASLNDLYRSPETQAQIYGALKATNPNYMVAPAGQSWHQAAVAADIARGPVLEYMRANTAPGLNFPFGQNDLVHVQMSNPAMAASGITRGARSAFGTTLTEAPGSTYGAPSPGAVQPTMVASAPAVSPVAAARAPATPGLPPRTPTPGVVDSLLAQYMGMPAYSRGSSVAANNPDVANQAMGLLTAAASPGAPVSGGSEAPAINRGDGTPIQIASMGGGGMGGKVKTPELAVASAMPQWYLDWLNTTGSNGGLLA